MPKSLNAELGLIRKDGRAGRVGKIAQPVTDPAKQIGGTRGPPKGYNKLTRMKCRGEFEKRIDILGKIADGQLGYRRRTKKNGDEYFEPTPRDRMQAMEMLAKYGGVTAEAEQTPEEAALSQINAVEALTRAMRDPTMRAWLAKERPELVEAMQDAIAPTEDAEYEVVGEVESGSGEDAVSPAD